MLSSAASGVIVTPDVRRDIQAITDPWEGVDN